MQTTFTFTQLVDDSFSRSDTIVAPGGNSTAGVGNGWIDLAGGIYDIKAAHGGLYRDQTRQNSPTDVNAALYQSASASLISGKVRIYTSTAATHTRGGVFRVALSNRHNARGYFVGFDQKRTQIVITKTVNGVKTHLLRETFRDLVLPTGYFIEASCLQLDNTQTQLTVAIFNPGTPTVPITQRKFIDQERALQNKAGIMGVSSDGPGFDAARITLFSAA
jgi:hypothetical protein